MSVGAATPEPRTSSSGQSTGAPGAVGPPLAGWLRGLGRAATRPVPYLSVRKMRPTTRGPGGPGLLPLPFPMCPYWDRTFRGRPANARAHLRRSF